MSCPWPTLSSPSPRPEGTRPGKAGTATGQGRGIVASALLFSYSPKCLELDLSHLGEKGVGYARHHSRPKEVSELRTLPPKMVQVLALFAPLFSKRVFQHVQVLVAGAILAPGRRTVSSALRAMGLEQEKHFHRYHRVLSRASWSSLQVSRLLLRLLVDAFVSEGSPLVVGIDETLE